MFTNIIRQARQPKKTTTIALLYLNQAGYKKLPRLKCESPHGEEKKFACGEVTNTACITIPVVVPTLTSGRQRGTTAHPDYWNTQRRRLISDGVKRLWLQKQLK